MKLGQMPSMVNWPALLIAIGGIPILFLTPLSLGRDSSAVESPVVPPATIQRRRFVLASMVLALLASFAVGTFEVGFNLFGGQMLGLASGTMAIMFATCTVAMLLAQSMMLFPAVRRRIDHRWLTATPNTRCHNAVG